MGAVGWGIYVHVPFCRRRCPYCPFNVHVRRQADWTALGRAIDGEWAARRGAMPSGPAHALYFGGGTPSLAPATWVAARIRAARAAGGLADDAEVTLEVNPGTVDAARLVAFRRAGVNRLSIGWQSSHDHLLARLGRDHDAAAARAAVPLARQAGFDNISLDLIFAVPGQTLAELDADLAAVARAAPEHVSMYALTYHAGTPFARWRAQGRLRPAGEGLELQMMRRIGRSLGEQGFRHYEISNFARPGRRARHNRAVWRGGEVLGLGPGAHSFAHRRWQEGWRWANVHRPEDYVAHWRGGGDAPGVPAPGDRGLSLWEALTPSQMVLERMLTGLRCAWGVRLSEPPLAAARARLGPPVAAAEARGWARLEDGRLRATAAGRRHADLLAALFVP